MDQMPDEAFDEALTLYLGYLESMLQEEDAPWFRSGLNVPHVKCLVLLEVHKEVTVGDLGKALGISRSSASAMIYSVALTDLLMRRFDPADGRRTLVSLSRAGRELAARLHVSTTMARIGLAR